MLDRGGESCAAGPCATHGTGWVVMVIDAIRVGAKQPAHARAATLVGKPPVAPSAVVLYASDANNLDTAVALLFQGTALWISATATTGLPNRQDSVGKPAGPRP